MKDNIVLIIGLVIASFELIYILSIFLILKIKRKRHKKKKEKEYQEYLKNNMKETIIVGDDIIEIVKDFRKKELKGE